MKKIGSIILALVAGILVLHWCFPEFTPEIGRAFSDGKWWADSVLNWFIFGLAVAFYVQVPEWYELWKYRNFEVITREGEDGLEKIFKLTPGDAKDILNHGYAGWQLIKSIASTSGIVNQPYYEEAIGTGFLKLDMKSRKIFLQLDKLGKRQQSAMPQERQAVADPALRS